MKRIFFAMILYCILHCQIELCSLWHALIYLAPAIADLEKSNETVEEINWERPTIFCCRLIWLHPPLLPPSKTTEWLATYILSNFFFSLCRG
jgi:hypothetical protein